MSAEVQQFAKQLQWAAEIYEYERNITRAASKLRTRIESQQQTTLDIRTCKSRIYAAIGYFSIDNNVATKVWEEDFANKYEDLATLALASDDIKTAKRCYDSAHECRVRASEASSKEAAWAPIFIISPSIELTQLGFEKRSLKEIAKKANDGYYRRLIEDLPIDEKEKQRLFLDAQIEDVEAEFESD